MTQTPTQTELKLYTFDEFIEWYPENSTRKYELHNGVIIEVPPATGDHADIISFLLEVILLALQQDKLPYRVSASVFVKTPNALGAYLPDMLVINHDNLKNEPLWKKQSTLIYPESIPVVIEIVSTNWQDDYYDKIRDYETMGIPEYWIVDYAALGGRKFIGNPKVPTIFVCELVDGEYQMSPFRGTDRIVSPTFPQLNLTAQQVFDSVV
ncbi:MAG: Uma2 family endonuclease [Cyanomargarita calcarea GSE-NOS-MK-12-04C]|jgi:Uma2 family endonuclease|uniref:Uma2 family endonuclease n=1 Tax=Cyanomargarita calcarea GSE-NOS-MK-12-04C TaxID=2839659 RepID=A0A951USY8_9CYAN|nr:Uma2 family endonuclease [Cyanomargarita calcarea GSE-NOS-MK-12-04C]